MGKENYYELLRKLTEFELKFREIKDFATLNLLILEIKSFIFGNDFLHVEFKNRLDEFLEQKNTIEFQQLIQTVYLQVKASVQRNAGQNMRNVEYQETVTQFPEYKATFTIDSEHKCTVYDRPNVFIYPSVLLPKLELDDNEFLQLLPLKVSCICGFYCEYFNIPLRHIPLGLEYYIFTGQPSLDFMTIEDEFILICIAISALYVLRDLWTLVEIKINSEYYSNKPFHADTRDKMLTERENELITLYKNGETSYKELAQVMGITERGVKVHLANINQKLSSNGTGLKALKETLKKEQ